MIEDMRRLVRLQSLMLQADGINEQIAAIPQEVARLEKELLAAQAEVEKEKSSMQDVQKERRRLEMELMGVETKIQKYQGQLAEVKTNKEYQAMLHEIEACRTERARLDEQILIDMEEGDKAGSAVKVHDERLVVRRRDTDRGKQALNERLAALKQEKAANETDQAELRKSIAPSYLDPFMKVARQRKNVALVAVREELCGGCHVRVMPKLIQLVRRSTGLIPCDSCKRFLYVPDDAAPAAPPGTDAPAPAASSDSSAS
jgi:predicted  nucleic acid-binding Zn-ribbon protein